MQHPSCRATKISQALALLDFEAKPWLQSHAWHTSASLQDMRALLLDLKQATGAQSLGHGSICDRLKIGYMGSVATSHGKAQQLASHQLCTRRNTELEPSGPTICAAQPGTTFVIQDLYYNLEQRRKVYVQPVPIQYEIPLHRVSVHACMHVSLQALGTGAEEYARILDLVGKSAISRPDVAFSCKKQV